MNGYHEKQVQDHVKGEILPQVSVLGEGESIFPEELTIELSAME